MSIICVMNPPKCDEMDYVQFLIAIQKAYSCTEAARVQPDGPRRPAHDTLTRLLHRHDPDPEVLWRGSPTLRRARAGCVAPGRHHAGRVLRPQDRVFDSWYASLSSLKTIAGYGWRWLTCLKRNWLVNPDRAGNRPVSEVDIGAQGLKGYGMIEVSKVVTPNGDIEYWGTNDLEMDEATRQKYTAPIGKIEAYHRGIKQFCGIDRVQVCSARAQRNHLQLALRAFLRLELTVCAPE